MLVEYAYMQINPGMEDGFAAMMAGRGIPLLAAIDGAQAVRIGRGVERPDTFVLHVEWRTMDAHVAFTKLPAFAEFRALMAPFTCGGSVEHFELA